tara:strand:+ start:386 stop:1627 length:1242 start_codon:yes stop_codon:yes gene_type:complete
MLIDYENNYLKIENVSITELSKKYSTPFYVYSTKIINQNYNKLRSNLNSNIYYSVKANSNQAFISLFSKLGAGADVVSGEELRRSLSADVKPSKIIFEGVGKSQNDIILAIKNNIKQINVESLEELELINIVSKNLNCKANIGIRINPDVEAETDNKISTGRKSDKFGINFIEIPEVIKKINNLKNIKFIGLSCHIGSQIFSLRVYENMFKKMKQAVNIFHENNLNIENLNLGGGMGFDYTKKKIFNINGLGKLVKKYFSNIPYNISFEPGRYLTANSGILITKIVMTKVSNKTNFLIVDAGMNTLLRPALYNAFHNIIPAINKKYKINYCVAGPICESSDIFVKNILLPKQNINDILIIEDVGAYGSVMSSNYNSKIFPTEIMVDDKNHSIIRSSQSIDKLINLDNIPDWIR